MTFVFALLCLGLLYAAWHNREEDRAMAIFFVVCALLNAGAAAHMVWTDNPAAFELQEDHQNDPHEDARPDRSR